MRIISLTLHNIASIEGPYCLNFEDEPLKSAGIFAITGATGSGKSTILDAICLALYDKTPRLSNVSSNVSMEDIQVRDARNLLRKGASSGYVKVVFSAIDNKLYEAEWTVRRAYNKASGSLQNVEIRLTNLSKNEPFPERRKSFVKEEIERLVGLNFDQFTKSVILAQGEFTSFLKADDDSRATILEKLTGTEIYRNISMEVFDKQSVLKNNLNEIEQIIQQYPLLSDENLTELKQNKEIVLNKRNESLAQKEKLSTQVEWFARKKMLEGVFVQTKTTYENVTAEMLQHQSRKNKLTRIQQVQNIKPDVIQKKDDEKKLQILEEKSTGLTQKITTQNQDITTQKKQIEQLNSTILAKKEWAKKLQPEIEQARKLDAEILNSTKLYDELQTELNEISNKNNTTKTHLLSNNQQLNELSQSLTEIEKWQAENQLLAQLKEREVWITSKTKELKEIQQELLHLQKQKEENTKFLAEANYQLENSGKEQEKIAIELDKYNTNLRLKQEQLTQIDKDQDVENQESILFKQEKIRNDFAVYQSFQLAVNQQKEVVQTIAVNQETIHQKSTELNKQKTLAEQLSIEVNILQKTVEKIRHIYDKSLSNLRDMLVKNEPCMVCGSTEHPYIEHTLQQIPDEVEANYATKKNEWEKAKEKIAGLQSTIELLHTQKVANENNLVLQEKNVLQAKEHWENCDSYQKAVDSKNTDDWFDVTTKSLNEALKKSQEKTQEINLLNTDIQNINTDIQNLSVTQKRIDNKQNEWLNRQKLLAHDSQIIIDKITDISQKKQKSEQELQQLLGNDFWWNKYNESEVDFWQNLNSGIQNWEKSMQNHTQYLKQKNELLLAIERLNQQNKHEDEQITKLTERLQKGKLYNEKLRQNRSSLLEGKSVEETEQSIDKQTEALITERDDANSEINKKEIELAGFQTQLNEAILNSKSLQEHIKIAKENIEKWLDNQADEGKISGQELTDLTQFTIEYIQAEESFFRELDERFTQVKTLFDEHQNNLNTHQNTHQPKENEEAIQEQLQQIETALKEITDQYQEVDYQLKRHAENLKKQQELIAEQQETYDSYIQWSELNNLIGSRDGKKFRLIAQEYTLDILLQYANQHLQRINQRYTLRRIDNSLSISITDHDMAGEIRSVNSLSGGESFLVSLALALALSSLSSTRLNVESLFIDEGFGTLDSDTLAVALDALEGLYHQGKKVGVISHVAEMSERIPVKIHLEKQGSGKSTIDIRWD